MVRSGRAKFCFGSILLKNARLLCGSAFTDSVLVEKQGAESMMGPRQVEQGALFYNFSLDAHVQADHMLRSVDRFIDLSGLHRELAPFYSSTGRPSVDPELMMRMLIIGYSYGIRSERRLCEEVHLNLAYRWF